jgi:hypothetical protein
MKPSMRDWAKETKRGKIGQILWAAGCEVGQFPNDVIVKGKIIK